MRPSGSDGAEHIGDDERANRFAVSAFQFWRGLKTAPYTEKRVNLGFVGRGLQTPPNSAISIQQSAFESYLRLASRYATSLRASAPHARSPLASVTRLASASMKSGWQFNAGGR